MKILSISIYKNDEKPAKLLASEQDLSSFGFFQRSSVGEFIKFFGSTISERVPKNERQSIEQEGMHGHIHSRGEGVAVIMITDKEYPSRVAFSLLLKIGDEFIQDNARNKWAENMGYIKLKAHITRYQDPQKADPIMKVQKELDETKIVMHKTIESVLQRGEKLDNLVDRSEQLSAQSKMFYKSAKSTNACCRLM